MKFGIIGGGFGYDCHFEALNNIQGVEIVGITDSGSGKLIKKLSNRDIYSKSIENLIGLRPDVIAIATPPKNHLDIISKVSQENIHILCEKPFCVSAIEGLNSTLLVEKYKIANCINFQYRFEPGIQFLKSKIIDLSIDKIKSIDVLWLTSGRKDPQGLWTWRNDNRQGGGVKNAFLVHIIDLIQWLLSSEIKDITKSNLEIIIPERKDFNLNILPVTAEDLVEVDFLMKKKVSVSCKVGNCNKKAMGLRISINQEEEKLIYEHKPPFRAVDQSVFIEKDKKSVLLFNASHTIPNTYKDTRTYSLRELYIRFIQSMNGYDTNNDLPTFKTGYQIKKIMEKIV